MHFVPIKELSANGTAQGLGMTMNGEFLKRAHGAAGARSRVRE
jgi:hypothetical protein